MKVHAMVLGLFLCAQSACAHAGVVVAATYWARLQTAASIREGHGPTAFAIFFDPNCPYCHHLYAQVQTLLRARTLTVEWIPVGILTLSSFGKAAALLRAPHPREALAAAENGFGPGGGAIVPRRATASIGRALRINEQLLGEGGAQGVPFVVYRGANGRAHTITGDPPSARLRALWTRLAPKTKRRRAKP
ncbi:MAG: thioredoxin fold domain-containing protein [Gammaproteobacteria bacterium]|nr:thioredoxin fold domain-containing protein [Gammaproteobacteria bacterium]